jgi:hypothetical protein
MAKTTKVTKFGKEMMKYVSDNSEMFVAKLSPAPITSNVKKQWMSYWEIEIGKNEFTKPGSYFLSFSDGQCPRCWKSVDCATLTCLMPVLNCDGINVMWDDSTKEILYACGIKKLKLPPF